MNGSTQAERLQTKRTPEQIQEQIRELGPWFHNLNLGGIRTAPDHFLGDYPAIKWQRFSQALPADLRGKSVLDIGCNAGFYSLEMKRRGADRVVGIDSSEHYLAQARFAAEISDLEIEFARLSVYEIEKLAEKFDLVLFLGVLYHLRYPLLALDLIREHAAKDIVVVQSMLRGSEKVESVAPDYPISDTQTFEKQSFPQMYFIEQKYSGDPTNWWIPNSACLQSMLRSAGFEILAHPETEVLIARIADRSPAAEEGMLRNSELVKESSAA